MMGEIWLGPFDDSTAISALPFKLQGARHQRFVEVQRASLSKESSLLYMQKFLGDITGIKKAERRDVATAAAVVRSITVSSFSGLW